MLFNYNPFWDPFNRYTWWWIACWKYRREFINCSLMQCSFVAFIKNIHRYSQEYSTLHTRPGLWIWLSSTITYAVSTCNRQTCSTLFWLFGHSSDTWVSTNVYFNLSLLLMRDIFVKLGSQHHTRVCTFILASRYMYTRFHSISIFVCV